MAQLYLQYVEAVAGARLAHLALQQPLVAWVQRGHQAVRLVLEVVREAPVRLPGEGPRVGVCVTDSLLDRVLEQGDVLLKVVGGPGVKHDVQELADVSPDLLGLAAEAAADDRDEPRAERVLEDELDAHEAAGRHDLGAVGHELDQRWHQELEESVHLETEKWSLSLSEIMEMTLNGHTALRVL